ncbi:MAG: hypothetical protein LBT97_01505 [Planctomycetota bacterium]|nr:hypothetical protein [Planctomycetota bacterium]
MNVYRPNLLLALLLPLPLTAGCSLGFRNLHPGEDGALYAPLFEDVINLFDEPRWLWVRGVASGDFDADAKVGEEAVIATVQSGDRRRPGPVESAYLLICRVQPDGKRVPIARTRLFEGHPGPTAPKPEYDACPALVEPFIHARAQIVPDKLKLGDSIAVFFWGDSYPTSVWYACFVIKDGALFKTFEGSFWQTNRGFAALNLDKRGGRDSIGYQLAFPVSPFPKELADKVGGWGKVPMWGHVYSPRPNGGYAQSDHLYGDHYDRIEIEWNEKFLEAVFSDLRPDELAWYEYHLGLLAHYTGKPGMARSYLEKAEAGAADGLLAAAIAKAKAILGQPVGRVGTPDAAPKDEAVP